MCVKENKHSTQEPKESRQQGESIPRAACRAECDNMGPTLVRVTWAILAQGAALGSS